MKIWTVFILYLFFWASNIVYGQEYTLEWERTLERSYSNWANQVIETKDGGLVLVGVKKSKKTSHDYWVAKLSKKGKFLWQRTFESVRFNWANSIIETSDNHLLLIGTSNQNDDHDILILKINTHGEFVWEKRIGTANLKEGATHALATHDNEIIIVGYQEQKSGERVINIFKINENAEVLWNKKFNKDFWNLGTSISKNSLGLYIIGAYTYGDKKGNSTLWVFALNENGDLVWEKTISLFGWNEIRSIFIKENNEILLTGLTTDPETKIPSVLLLNFNSLGELKKQKIISHSRSSSWGTSIIVNQEGYIILASTGLSKDQSGDIFFTMLNKQLIEIASERFGDPQWNESYNLLQTKDNGLVLLGTGLEAQTKYQNAKIWKFQWKERQDPNNISIKDLDFDTFDPEAILTLNKIQFQKGSYILLPEAEEEVKRLGLLMLQNKKLKIKLLGHTSTEGKADKNLNLAHKRLKVVKNYLINKHIDENRIETQAFGETKPICEEKTEQCQAKNRRVEMKILEY